MCDPPGAKIGNGGAAMHVLEQLQMEIDSDKLLKGAHNSIYILPIAISIILSVCI